MMKTFSRFLLLLIISFLIAGRPAPAAGGPPSIALIVWQLDGQAEDGFRSGIQKVYPEARFYVYSAAGDRALLDILIGIARERRHDLYYVSGTPAAKEVLTRIKDKPVVFTMVQAPIEEGIIASWRTSQNNATGVSNRVPILNQLNALKRVVPFRRLGVLFNPQDPDSVQQVSELARLQPFLHFELRKLPISSPRDLRRLDLPGIPPVDAVYLAADPLVHQLGAQIIERTNKARLPTLAADLTMVTHKKALLGLVPDNYQVGHLAAQNALAVLGGTPPANVPSKSLDFFMVVLNMQTARILDVQIPLSLLVIADTIVR